MDDETAQRIVEHEAERQEAADTLKAAQAIVREQRQVAIRQRSGQITQARKDVESAKARIDQHEDRRLGTRLGGGPTDHDVREYLDAKARLQRLETTPVPGPGEPVLDQDVTPAPSYCIADGVPMNPQGRCPVCQGSRGHNPFPGHAKNVLMDHLRRGVRPV
jgi:hypothetical protein